MLAHQFRLAEAKARRQDLARRLRAALEHDGATEDLRQHFEAAPRYTPPAAKRYLVNDTTVEKLGELLNHNPNGLLLFRDELSGFLHMMDRPGHENDRAFYCEAWNGTGAYTYEGYPVDVHRSGLCAVPSGLSMRSPGNSPNPEHGRNAEGRAVSSSPTVRHRLFLWRARRELNPRPLD